jgi:HK97 family phage portal protein
MVGKGVPPRPLTPQMRVAAAKAALRDAREQLALVTPQQANRPTFTDWSTANAIQNGLKASEWVYACVRKLADAISAAAWFVEQRVGEDEWERDDSHPLSNLLSRPNPYMSRQDLFERAAYHLYLGGNAVWHLERNSAGIPQNIVPLMPDQIKPVPAGTGLEVARYEYRIGSLMKPLEPQDICHLMIADPGTPFWGLAPLRAAMQTVDTDVEAVRWNKVSLQNRAVTDGLFAFKHPLTEEQWEDAQEQVKEQHLGADNAHMPWVLGSDASYTPMSLSPVEMDFLKTRQFNVSSICFAPGARVITERGVQPIEDVVPGTLVLTHRGRYRKVTAISEKLYEGPMVRLKAKALDSALVTPNHPYLAVNEKPTRTHRRRHDGDQQWIAADQLRVWARNSRRAYDQLTLPVPTNDEPPAIDGADYDLAKLIGLYAADGCSSKGGIVIYLGPEEEALGRWAAGMARERFGARVSVRRVQNAYTNVWRVEARSQRLRELLREMCGGAGASKKRLPNWLISGSDELARGALAGLVAGDGSLRTPSVVRFCTTSATLAWQVRLLVLRFGAHASIRTARLSGTEGCIGGRHFAQSDRYDLQWPRVRRRPPSITIRNGYAHYAMQKAEREPYCGPVYNLQVEEDESYVTTSGAVHNCNVFGVPVVLVTQERTTFNNMEVGRKIFWEDTVIPRLDDLGDALDLRLCPYWNPEGLKDASKKTLRVSYDVSGIPAMQSIWREKVDSGRKLWDMGVPFNEVNQRLELGVAAVEGGDLPWGGSKPPTLGYAPISEPPKTAVPALEVKSGMAADEKAAYWKAFDNDRARWEDRIAKQIATLFMAEGEAVGAAFEGGGKAAIVGAIERNKTQWSVWLMAAYKQMIAHFGTLEGRRIIRAIPKGAMPELQRKALEYKERAWAFDFDDPAVEHFIRSETAQKVTAMSQTTRDAIAEGVAEGLSQNEGASDIAKRIRASYADWAGEGDSALDRSRSFLIARTEAGAAVNFGHNMGALQVEKQTGAVVLKEWISSRDDRVRDSHAMVDGEIRALHEGFSNGLLYPNAPGAPAEEVINCFPGDTMVQARGIEKAYRRWYEGPLIEITTSLGHKLAGTPNHPIWTRDGFVALGSLKEGDNIICGRFRDEEASNRNPDVENVPTAIGQVFHALATIECLHRMPGLSMDFHGDGRNGEVEIVTAYRLLHRDSAAAVSQPLGDDALALADLLVCPLPPQRAGTEFLLAPRLSADRGMGGRGQPLSLVGAGLAHPQVHGLGAVAGGDASFEESAPDNCTLDAEALGDGLLGKPRTVEFDDDRRQVVVAPAGRPEREALLMEPFEHRGLADSVLSGNGGCPDALVIEATHICEVRIRHFAGHVYNLQTHSGCYIAGGIIAQNCRCAAAHLVEGLST